MSEEFKRNIAFKCRINELIIGKPIIEEGKFSFLEIGAKRIIRVNIVGIIVNKYQNDNERKYLFLTIDDGSNQINIKVFGDDVSLYENLTQGTAVLIIGNLRNWNNETYITPEIIRQIDSKYITIRKLEVEKELKKNPLTIAKDQMIAVKDKILGAIKNSEENGGIEIENLILNFQEISPTIIDQEVKKMLEEGIIFEPRPGKVRYLG